MKLTPKQNAVIYCLQNGFELFTASEFKGAFVYNETIEFRISNSLFYSIVKLGLIYQSNHTNQFDYVLSDLGKNIKTKPVNF